MGDGEQGEGSLGKARPLPPTTSSITSSDLGQKRPADQRLHQDVMCTDPLEERYKAFGWAVKVINGTT
jgi:transketolase N-terminal domain/subunit